MSHHWHPVLVIIFNLMSTYRSTYQPQTSKYLTMWVSTKVISPPNLTPPSVSRSGELVPEFSAGFPDNVTVQRESAAFLDCPVKNPGDRPVSYPLVNIILYYLYFLNIFIHRRSPGWESETGTFWPTAWWGSPRMTGSMCSTKRDHSTGFCRWSDNYYYQLITN